MWNKRIRIWTKFSFFNSAFFFVPQDLFLYYFLPLSYVSVCCDYNGKQLFIDIRQNSCQEKFGNISKRKIVWWSSVMEELQSSRQHINLLKRFFQECYFKDIECYFKITIQNTLRQLVLWKTINDSWQYK